MLGYSTPSETKKQKQGRPVEVDQGALVRKILARYPGEFTLFRELLQNSDDAQSDSVQIFFETAGALRDPPEISDLKPSDIVQWTFKNNGKPFTDGDWARLSKIAKGNDNPKKVGAFGVGFYSLFSVTDHPTVLSGGAQMQFYWMDSQLYFDHTKTPSVGESTLWTTIKVPLRKPGEMPDKIDFMRFLATSITFMAHLKHVEVSIDGDCLGCIMKTPGAINTVNCPISLPHSSSSKIMTVCGLQRHRFSIQAEISTKIGESKLTEIPKTSEQCRTSSASRAPHQSNNCRATSTNGDFCTTKVDLTLFTAEVDVRVSEELSEGLLWSTYKSPPSKLDYNLVYTGKDEYDQSLPGREPNSQPFISVFQGLRADLDGATHPRIFIGHSTSQTTGIGGHMAAPFISTVERESIDLVDKNVAIWNSELLHIGGFLARVVYELELTTIDTLWQKATTSGQPEIQDQLYDRFIHVLRFFTFYDSTPSLKVARQMQHSFYDCSASSLRLLSSVGVYHATDIRLFDPLRSRFLKYVPMLPPEVAEVARRILNTLPKEQKIRTITVEDMSRDLGRHVLEEAELLSYLEWQTGSPADMARLSKVVNFQSANGTSIRLSTITSFIDTKSLGAHIPLDGPLPLCLIPRGISRPFNRTQLAGLGWREFTITDWLSYISQQDIRSANPRYDFVQSAEWAERVLHTISLAWSSDEVRDLAKSAFKGKKCVPVKHELHSPTETYLPDGNILVSDHLNLQIVQFPSGREIGQEMKDLLVAIGVKQHLAPTALLKQMMDAKWNTSRLIDYLVKVASSLSHGDIDELRLYDAFASEGGQGDNGRERFRVHELYPPIPTFRQLHLQLIDWSGRSEWKDESPEAKLLYRLGLRRHPPMEDIVNLCSQDTDVGKRAFNYLCTNLRTVYSGYGPDEFRHRAFIPATNTSGVCLEKLDDVFLDIKWEVFGLSVIQHKDRENILEELGVRRHPPSSLLLRLLEKKSHEETSRQCFEILSNHISCFEPDELTKLSRSPIVPKTISGHEREWLTPIQCYLGKSMKHDLYSRLFHFVDFGSGAIQFLRACGAKYVPSVEDVAEYLVENSERFYTVAGHERFMQELGDLAAQQTRISNITMSKMKLRPILPGTRREKTQKIPALREPKDIVIVNDVDAYHLFGDSIIAAPENMTPKLEDFYASLGCRYLTTVIQEKCKPFKEKADHPMRPKYVDLIRTGLLLFHHHHKPPAGTATPRFTGSIDVRFCERITVSKTIVIQNEKNKKDVNVWATAENERGTIKVWISSDSRRDMYGLAVSLCRALYEAVKLNDALLLMHILSEDNLDVLRRRGYDVDQALQSKFSNESDVAGKTDACCSITSEAPSSLHVDFATQKIRAATDADSVPANPEVPPSAQGSDMPTEPTTSSTTSYTLAKFTNMLRTAYHRATRSTPRTAPRFAEQCPGAEHPVTPQKYIRSMVEEAIRACKSSPLNHGGSQANMANFKLDDDYCNVSDRIENLKSLGPMGGVEVLVDQGVSNVDSFKEEMQDQVDRFVRILTSLVKVYNLPLASLRIFYDTATGCIAFNRKNIIHLNLRYFEAWHYQDVKCDNSQQALLSWFFTIAHEIAHSLVADHNTEHEFLFSAICEAHMKAFSRLSGTSVSG